jgi:hypothetical protein
MFSYVFMLKYNLIPLLVTSYVLLYYTHSIPILQNYSEKNVRKVINNKKL